MHDDQIIAQRFAGTSVRAIAEAAQVSPAEINRVIDAWADSIIDDKLRKHSLALELTRRDELQQVFYRRAIDDADVQSGLLLTKLIERRCVALGLYASQAATLQIIESTAPKETTTTGSRRRSGAFSRTGSQGRRSDDPLIYL